MKKKVLSVLLAVLMIIGLFAPMATATSTPPAEPAGEITLLGSLIPSSATIPLGSTQQFIRPAGTVVSWSSASTSIATVDSNGLVTAAGLGSTTITCTVDGTNYTATVTIVPAGTPFINISPGNLTLVAGGSAEGLTATGGNLAGATIVWASSLPAVASVSPAGLVTPLTAGTTTITASATVGGTPVSASVTVTVAATAAPSITVTPTVLTLNAGGSAGQLTATPSNLGGATITWSSSAPAIATVSATGLVTPLTTGTATITASATVGGATVSDTATVIVDPGSPIQVPEAVRAPIAVGASRTLTATVPGANPQPALVWSIVTSTFEGAAAGRVVPSLSGTGNNILNAGNRTGTITLRVSLQGTPTVYTQFTINVVAGRTVVFNLNGGTWPTTGLTQSAVGTLESAIDGVGTPRRLGHTFDGWWTTATGTGTRVDRDTLLTSLTPATGNITLFARWTAATNTAAVPANSTITTIFPDANLAARVAASLATTFNATVNVGTRIFASDLAQIETLNLARAANLPIVDLRGIPTLTGVRTVSPATGLAAQNITLPSVARTTPLNHTNVVRDRLGAFVNPSTISNNGAIVAGTTPANNTIRWTNIPANAANVTYAWNVQNVLIGNQNVTFSGTATLPFGQTMNFVDVNPNNWFYDAVSFVFYHGYMEGTSDTTFSPNTNLTRAQVAVILYRMAGEPSVTGGSPFTDVTTAWQRDAVIWAAANDIVNGIGDGLFAPNRSVTREEFAAMFHRFAVFSGTDVTIPGSANLDHFPDRADVSNWAVDYMRWATYTGLITGTTDGRLMPRGTTTRAQCAQIIQRFVTG